MTQVILIAVPPGAWATVPGDRPLADLATDALGSARRILKGSNARRERLRYTRLTGYIGSVALQLSLKAGTRALRLHAERADGYLDLVELLGRRAGASGDVIPASGRVLPVITSIIVVLPAPLGPMMQRSSPASIESVSLFRARKPSKLTVMSSR